jgi:hypothetical protein
VSTYLQDVSCCTIGIVNMDRRAGARRSSTNIAAAVAESRLLFEVSATEDKVLPSARYVSMCAHHLTTDGVGCWCTMPGMCIKQAPAQQGAAAGARSRGISDSGHEVALRTHIN